VTFPGKFTTPDFQDPKRESFTSKMSDSVTGRKVYYGGKAGLNIFLISPDWGEVPVFRRVLRRVSVSF
jgi:hypothetical protein